jgi:hypothetical protein
MPIYLAGKFWRRLEKEGQVGKRGTGQISGGVKKDEVEMGVEGSNTKKITHVDVRSASGRSSCL